MEFSGKPTFKPGLQRRSLLSDHWRRRLSTAVCDDVFIRNNVVLGKKSSKFNRVIMNHETLSISWACYNMDPLQTRIHEYILSPNSAGKLQPENPQSVTTFTESHFTPVNRVPLKSMREQGSRRYSHWIGKSKPVPIFVWLCATVFYCRLGDIQGKQGGREGGVQCAQIGRELAWEGWAKLRLPAASCKGRSRPAAGAESRSAERASGPRNTICFFHGPRRLTHCSTPLSVFLIKGKCKWSHWFVTDFFQPDRSSAY